MLGEDSTNVSSSSQVLGFLVSGRALRLGGRDVESISILFCELILVGEFVAVVAFVVVCDCGSKRIEWSLAMVPEVTRRTRVGRLVGVAFGFVVSGSAVSTSVVSSCFGFGFSLSL